MYNIGTVLEPGIGTTRFIVYYAVILIAGGWISCMWHEKTSPRVICIGASGTICGLLGIYMVMLMIYKYVIIIYHGYIKNVR